MTAANDTALKTYAHPTFAEAITMPPSAGRAPATSAA